MQVLAPTARLHKTEPSNTTTDHPSRQPWPTRQPVNDPLFDARFRRLVDHLRRLGPRPVSELLKELMGNNDELQADTLFLLEKYAALDPEIVCALGADTFPPSIFPVGPT